MSNIIKNAPNATADAIRRGEKLPELLCPAGSYAALEAAVDGGADAIYLGGLAFNARKGAKNFSRDELERGIALAHAYGTKIYLALNTLIHDRELDELLHSVEEACTLGADALIVADLGAAREIRRRFDIELHASTQVSGHNADATRYLADAGFSRMVCAREMSREDIRTFIDTSSLEAEVFVHGALCVCHSGQCLFSSVVGGRSGNRGECAQPCRLPYKNKNAYPLSLKDLSLASHIPKLCELGVASLKIEGRMKSPEYVRDVTRIWRRLLDERRAATRDDMRELEAVFSRQGFTDGYFTSNISSKMLGVRTEAQKRESRELEAFDGLGRKIGVTMTVQMKKDTPIKLTVFSEGARVSVTGDVPMQAINAPLDKAALERSMSKLGGTPYELTKIDIELDEGLMMPVSALNALRRSAIEALAKSKTSEPVSAREVEIKRITPKNKKARKKTAAFYNPKNVTDKARKFFDVIYLPLESYDGSTNGAILPPVIFDSEADKVRQMLISARERGCKHLLVANIGHLSLVGNMGFELHGDIRLNVYNNATAAVCEELGLEDVLLSPELTLPQMRDIGGATGACVYGRLPLMITEKCVSPELDAKGGCDSCKQGRAALVDRRGVSFPVLRTFEHRSLIFNSVPVYMADKSELLDRNGIVMQHFIFTTESSREVDDVIEAYLRHSPTDKPKTRMR